jgi:hypothetical protein
VRSTGVQRGLGVSPDSTPGAVVARLRRVMIKWNIILERLNLPDHLYTDRLRSHIPRPGPVSLRVRELEMADVPVDEGFQTDPPLTRDQLERPAHPKEPVPVLPVNWVRRKVEGTSR